MDNKHLYHTASYSIVFLEEQSFSVSQPVGVLETILGTTLLIEIKKEGGYAGLL